MGNYKTVISTDSFLEVFDHTHSQQIYRARSNSFDHKISEFMENIKKILPALPDDAIFQTPSNLSLPRHGLVARRLLEKDTGNVYVCEKVCLQFYGGWFYGALLNHGGSHSFLYFENHSCINETVIEGIQEFWDRFSLVE